MKRKFMTIALATCLVLGMSTSVFAAAPQYKGEGPGEVHLTNDDATNTNTAGTEATTEVNKDVNIKVEYTEEQVKKHVIAASIDKSELTFTYHAKQNLIWNPVELKYEDGAKEGEWTGAASQSINIKNYSDVPLQITATAPTATNDTSFTLDKDNLTLEAVTPIGATGPTTGTISVSASGIATESTTTPYTLKLAITPQIPGI